MPDQVGKHIESRRSGFRYITLYSFVLIGMGWKRVARRRPSGGSRSARAADFTYADFVRGLEEKRDSATTTAMTFTLVVDSYSSSVSQSHMPAASWGRFVRVFRQVYLNPPQAVISRLRATFSRQPGALRVSSSFSLAGPRRAYRRRDLQRHPVSEALASWWVLPVFRQFRALGWSSLSPSTNLVMLTDGG